MPRALISKSVPRVDDAGADGDLGREVEHRVGVGVPGQDLAHPGGVADVGADESGDAMLPKPGEVLVGPAPAQVVDENDVVPLALEARARHGTR